MQLETSSLVNKSSKGSSASTLLGAAGLILVFIYPLLFRGMFAGDSEIHLVYGENAAQGHYFEFNPGEKSPGVTSPGYMMFLAMLFKTFPIQWVPLAMKGANLLGWY